MDSPDRKKACEILGISPDATKDEIYKRYDVFARKFKTIEKDENGYTFKDITKAYNLAMGITYVDKAEQERQKKLRENPSLLSKVTKKDPVKIENFFHYYRVHIISGILAIFLLFSIIKSCVNNVPPDFSLILFGSIAAEDQNEIGLDLTNKYPDIITAPSVEGLTLMTDDPQYEDAVRMKIVALVAANDADIILFDEATFREYSAQGFFLALDDLTDELGFPADSYVEAAAQIDETEKGLPIFEEPRKYGVDITDSAFVKDNKIYARKVIATIVVNSERIEKAKTVLKGMK